MKNKEIQDALLDIGDELHEIETMILEKPFNKGNVYHTRYAVVRACGSVESAFKQIIFDHFAESVGDEKINNYLEKSILRSSMNPRLERMRGILKQFDASWDIEFKNMLDQLEDIQKKKDSLKSLVDLRNQFAHGTPINASISSVIEYYHDALEILKCYDNSISQ